MVIWWREDGSTHLRLGDISTIRLVGSRRCERIEMACLPSGDSILHNSPDSTLRQADWRQLLTFTHKTTGASDTIVFLRTRELTYTECKESKQCHAVKHHYDECVERVTAPHEDSHDKKHPNEDCVEECMSPPSPSYCVFWDGMG